MADGREVLVHLNITVPDYVANMGNDAAVEFALKEVEISVKAGRLHELVAMAELT